MTATIRRYASVAFLIMMMLAINISTVLGQEEAEAVENSGSDGLMIALIGIGLLVVLGLGAAMSAQAKDENVY